MLIISTRKIILFLTILVFIFGGISSYFYLREYVNNKSESKAFINSLIKDVSKLVLVPDNERPTVAKVSDPDPLRSDMFFYDAKQDDYVLIYTFSKKAILYRASIGKVINIAPIDNNLLKSDNSNSGSPEEFFPKSFPNSVTKVKVDNF